MCSVPLQNIFRRQKNDPLITVFTVDAISTITRESGAAVIEKGCADGLVFLGFFQTRFVITLYRIILTVCVQTT